MSHDNVITFNCTLQNRFFIALLSSARLINYQFSSGVRKKNSCCIFGNFAESLFKMTGHCFSKWTLKMANQSGQLKSTYEEYLTTLTVRTFSRLSPLWPSLSHIIRIQIKINPFWPPVRPSIFLIAYFEIPSCKKQDIWQRMLYAPSAKRVPTKVQHFCNLTEKSISPWEENWQDFLHWRNIDKKTSECSAEVKDSNNWRTERIITISDIKRLL